MAKRAFDVTRQNRERGNATPPFVVRGQTAPKPGKARAGKPGTSRQRPSSQSGSSRPNSAWRS